MPARLSKNDKIKELLERGVDSVYPSTLALEKRLQSGKPLTLYLGVDPSGADLHIGHMIPLLKLRQFQQLGHKVILLIGDFTGRTGDPTDKQATRVPLTPAQVKANAKHYQKHAALVLDFEGPNKAEVRYNSKWLSKLTFDDVTELAEHFTVQQLLERDMFEARLKANKPISLREFLYPLMQGYDSVAMDVDLEVGGTDQTFNMLAGRKLAKQYNDKDKFVLTMKLLADSNGVKVGKTAGNAIAVLGKPADLRRQLMDLPDEVIAETLELCTTASAEEVAALAKLAKQDPYQAKQRLAEAVIRQYQGEAAAEQAEQAPAWKLPKAELPLWEVLKRSGLAASSSEAHRLIGQGAVKVNGIAVDDPHAPVIRDTKPLIQVGKKKSIQIS